MSVIVSLCQNNETWIGSDSMASRNGHMVGSIPKWAIVGRAALGTTGDFSFLLQVKTWAADLFYGQPQPAELVSRLKGVWKNAGYEPRPQTDDTLPWWDFRGIYVRDNQQVWDLDGCLNWIPQPDCWGEGSGCDYALGALYAAPAESCAPEMRLRTALAAACYYHVGCRPPLHLWHLGASGGVWEAVGT